MTNTAAFALGAPTGPGPSFDGIKGEWQIGPPGERDLRGSDSLQKISQFLTERAAEAR